MTAVAAMRISPVDPRDISWEQQDPVYRVYFKSADGVATEEYELLEASVDDVLAWARLEAPRRGSFVVYTCVELRGERGLLRLADSGDLEGKAT